MKLIFLGPPGAGKGTQAKILATTKHLAHISTGEMLRSAAASGTPLGLKVKPLLDSGQLVPDEVVIGIIKERIAQPDCESGFILDGFPRTLPQAQSLTKMLSDLGVTDVQVVLFEVSDAAVRSRLDNRRSSESRADDSEAVQRERIKVYLQQTAPVIDYYRDTGRLVCVDGSGPIEEVQHKLLINLKAGA